MAKHVSRLQSIISSNQFQLFCRNPFARLKCQQIRGQHSKPSPELPKPRTSSSGDSGKGGFFTWRNVGFFALGGAGFVGYQMYVNSQTERGEMTANCLNHQNISIHKMSFVL